MTFRRGNDEKKKFLRKAGIPDTETDLLLRDRKKSKKPKRKKR